MTEKSVEQSGLTVGTVLGLTHKTNGETKNEISLIRYSCIVSLRYDIFAWTNIC